MALQARPNEEERLQTWEEVQDYAAKKDVSVRLCQCTRGMRVADDQVHPNRRQREDLCEPPRLGRTVPLPRLRSRYGSTHRIAGTCHASA